MSDFRVLRNFIRSAPLSARVCALAAVATLASLQPALAQDAPTQTAPAHISVIDGDVSLDRDVDSDAADVGMPVVPGDRLRTQRGRAEVMLPDASALDLDEYTDLDIQSPQLLRLTAGRLKIIVPRDSTSRYQVDTPAATAYIDAPGEYRVAIVGGGGSGSQAELAVIRGRAELAGDRGSVNLEAGERSLAWANDLPSRPESFNSARFDAFDRWTADQRDTRSSSASVQYLPPDLRVYGGALDRSGSWQYDTTYGYVWYPTVAADWRPYYSGYWATVPAYGWTWIGAERWAWPTHHYGRWGYARSHWFWIPDRRWSPAWVSWGAAPGYVSWCPLGYDNRPVFDLSVSIGNAWGGGWVVLPRDRFGFRRERVNTYAISTRSLPPRTPFVLQSAPPIAARAAARRAGADGGRITTPTRSADRNQAVPRQRRLPDASASTRPDNGGVIRRDPNAPAANQTGDRAVMPRAMRRNPQAVDQAPAADNSGSAGARRAVPRASTPSNQPAPGQTAAQPAAPPTARQPVERRQYPFGDFRRRDPNSPANDAPQQDGPQGSSPGYAVPRARPGVQDNTAAPWGRPRGPETRGNDSAVAQPRAPQPGVAPTPPAAPTPPGPSPYVIGRPQRDDGNRGGSISTPSRGERNESGGAVRRAPQSPPQPQSANGNGNSTGGQASGNSSSRGDAGNGGRSHDPDSRRPRR